MTIHRWDPSGNVFKGQDRIDRMFDQEFPCGSDPEDPDAAAEWRPRVDIYQKEDRLVISADLPGVERPDLSVEWNDGVLTIGGLRKPAEPVAEGRYFRRERRFGTFSRAFSFREPVDAGAIQAAFHNGVLRVEVPFADEDRPRKIAVRVHE